MILRRIRILKLMHEMMQESNDENLYLRWICFMPDCPNENDFEFIAEEDDEFNAATDLFRKLIAERGCL